jgi:hypothetical protein
MLLGELRSLPASLQPLVALIGQCFQVPSPFFYLRRIICIDRIDLMGFVGFGGFHEINLLV